MSNKNQPFTKGDRVAVARKIRSTAGSIVKPDKPLIVKFVRYLRKKKTWVVYLVGHVGAFLARYFTPVVKTPA